MLSSSSETRRVALVVGNGEYRHAPTLENTVRDAEAVADALTRLGFATVSLYRNIEQSQLSKALADLGEAAVGAEIAVVYFAGHGMEIDGENYLLPVEAELKHVNRVKFESQSLRDIVYSVTAAKTLGLIILDSCRDNPFRSTMKGLESTRSAASQGLTTIEPTGNTLVVYAAKHGTLARDGQRLAHSPFTQAFLDYVERPNLELRLMFGKVRDAVLEATNRQQEPHVYGSLGGKEIFLTPTADQNAGSNVFISYARKDKEFVAKIAKLLSQEGLNVFWDQDLIVGQDWREVIENRLRGAQCVVAVWSQNSINSDWVKFEAARGQDKGILVPVSIDGSAAPRVFDKIQTQDLANWDGTYADNRIARLLTGVRSIIKKTAPPSVADQSPVALAIAPLAEKVRAVDPLAIAAQPSRSSSSGGVMTGLLALVVLGLGAVAVILWQTQARPTGGAQYSDRTVTNAAPQVNRPAAPAPSYSPPPPPPPEQTARAEEPATGRFAQRLEFKDCAIVLEAVKTCEDLKSCSADTVQENFTTGERQFFESINGRAAFTTERFYGHCREVCGNSSYKLKPARTLLCGY